MVIFGLGSGDVRKNKAIALSAKTFMLGSMAAHQHSGKCVEPTAANSLDITQKGGRLALRCHVNEEMEKASPSRALKMTQQ